MTNSHRLQKYLKNPKIYDKVNLSSHSLDRNEKDKIYCQTQIPKKIVQSPFL